MCKRFLLSCWKWTLRSLVFCIGVTFWFFSVIALSYFVFILLSDMHSTITGQYPWREMAPKYSARIVEIEMMRNFYVMCGHSVYELDRALQSGSYFSGDDDDVPVDVLNITLADDDNYYVTKQIPFDVKGKRSITSTEKASRMKRLNPGPLETTPGGENETIDLALQQPSARAPVQPPVAPTTPPPKKTEPPMQNLNRESKYDFCTLMMLKHMKNLRQYLQKSLKNIFNTINYRYAVAFICTDIMLILLNALFCAACSLLLAGARRKRVTYMLAWIPVSGAALLCDITYWITRGIFTHPPNYYSFLTIILIVIFVIIAILIYACCVCIVLQFFYFCFTADPDMPIYYHKTVPRNPSQK